MPLLRRALALLLPLLLLSISTSKAQVPTGSLLRLSADSGLVLNGSTVSAWRDISGNGNDAVQADSTHRPTVLNGGVARSVRFGGNAYLAAPSVFPTASDYTLAFVVRVNSYTTANNVVSGNLYAHYFGSAPYINVLHAGDFTKQSTSQVGINTGWNVVVVRYFEATGNASISVNGVQGGTAQVPANADPTLFIGAFQAANYLIGDLGEVALWNRALSSVEAAGLQSTWIAQYGIAAPKPYSPPAASPLLWLKADSGVEVVNGRVARWADRSGNNSTAFQNDTALQPTWLPNATFDIPAVRFPGNGNYMELPSVFPTLTDYSLTFVVRITNLGGTNNVVSGTTYAHYFGGGDYALVLHNGDFNSQAVASIPVVQGEFAIVTVLYNNSRTRAALYINGNFADSATVPINPDSTLYLGAFQRSSVLFGDLAEVLLYRRELTPTERATTEGYLFKKYGIAVPPPPPPPDSTFTSIPAQLQLFPRGADDSATARVAGAVRTPGWERIRVRVEKDGASWQMVEMPLSYQNGTAAFDLAARLHAELAEYRFTVSLHRTGGDTTIAVRDSILCGDALLICGQSNSIFGGNPATSEWCRTFGRNFSSNARDTLWTTAGALGYGGGPDIGAWGMTMAQLYTAQSRVPVAVINGGVGGTQIELHQRNDVAPYTLSTIYGSMLYRVVRSGLAASARTMLWYQGESNTVTNYAGNFRALYEDWQHDYPNLEKVYVVQIRPGCAAGPHRELRELLRTLSDSLPDIVTYSPMGVDGHDGCHYLASGYDTIGVQLSRLVARDLLGSSDTLDIGSPDIRRAFYTSAVGDEIALVFDNARTGLLLTPDTTVGGVNATIAGAFILNDSTQGVSSVRASGDTLYLRLSEPMTGGAISYIPDQNYPGTAVIYEGPWVKNRRGLGAFSFNRIPIEAFDTATVGVERRATVEMATVLPNPTGGASTLRFTLRGSGTATVELVGPSGNRVALLDVQGVAGENSLSLPTAQLPAGIYYCRLTTADQHTVLPIVVAR